MAETGTTLTVSSAREWRAWLRKNHARATAVRLVFFKKHTGKSPLTYREALEEAICFGWIDGLKKSLDADRYTYRFSPRKSGSKWSPRNLDIAEQLIAAGRMTQAGRRALEAGSEYDQATLDSIADKAPELAPEMEKAIKANRRAWKHFIELSAGYRRQYVLWLNDAKRPETRQRRLAEAIRLLENNEKPGMR